ncbi:MAG: NUDIX domain-containing protein [Candidatus Taylorbacteria bacterium]
MQIKSKLTNREGKTLEVVYRDVESISELGERKVSSVKGYCFFGDKLVVVYSGANKFWTLAGGGVEKGESPEEGLIREVKEETNMEVLAIKLVGFQDVYEPTRVVTQARYVCIVRPFGPFTIDPDGDVTEIKLIEPKDYKSYFDWGIVGEHLIERALEVRREMT